MWTCNCHSPHRSALMINSLMMATRLKYWTHSCTVRPEEHTSVKRVLRRLMTNVMQFDGMLEVLHCCPVNKRCLLSNMQIHETCYRQSAPFLYEVASHVKNCHSGHYYYYYVSRSFFRLSSTVDDPIHEGTPVVSSMRYMLWIGRGCVLAYARPFIMWTILFFAYTVSHIASKPLPVIMATIEHVNESKWCNRPSRMRTPERGLCGSAATTIALAYV